MLSICSMSNKCCVPLICCYPICILSVGLPWKIGWSFFLLNFWSVFAVILYFYVRAHYLLVSHSIASNQFDNVLAHSPHVAQSLLFIGIFRSVRMEACGRSRFMFAYRSEMLTNERFISIKPLEWPSRTNVEIRCGLKLIRSQNDMVLSWYGLSHSSHQVESYQMYTRYSVVVLAKGIIRAKILELILYFFLA